MPERPFSERMGLVQVAIQTEGMDSNLRNSIWNFISALFELTRQRNQLEDQDRRYRSVELIAVHVLRVPVENVDNVDPMGWLLRHFSDLPWTHVYDALELVVLNAPFVTNGRLTVEQAMTAANGVLAREHSGFRFIGGELTRNIHPAEAAEVEHARVRAAASGFNGVRQHIEQALSLFGKRPEPDYRNAIKEAISAVEGVIKLIQEVRGGGIKDALDALSPRIEIHPALRDGLVKLYGFTSDGDGIRHPILDRANVGEDDARFMIVTCSAFVNFLISKAAAAGLLKSK